jgi:hypothetical protein
VLALWTLLAAQGARRQFALDSMSEEAQRPLQTKTPEEQQKLAMSGGSSSP